MLDRREWYYHCQAGHWPHHYYQDTSCLFHTLQVCLICRLLFFVLLFDICNIGLFSLSLFSGSYYFALKLSDGISCWLRIWIFKKLECAILRANYVNQSNSVDFWIFSRIICEIFLYLDDLNVVGSFFAYA